MQPTTIDAAPRILIVDDDPDVSELLGRVLVREGYAVTTAAHGNDALERLNSSAFSLIISDVNMPGIDGFQFVSDLRELGLSDVPVILMSALHDQARRVTGLNLGADDFVAKPIDTHELLARVRAQLRRSQRQLEMARASVLDPLTRVLNRRGVAQVFEQECARLRRQGGSISVLALDINDFKLVNDTHGHAAGDLVLSQLSRAIEQVIRASDRIGRMGGDEFVVLMPGDDMGAATQLARRISALSPLDINLPSGVRLSVGFSVGTASADADVQLEVLLERADLAMYGEKRESQRAAAQLKD